MAGDDKIRIPWSSRWRRFRHGVLPLLTFGACVVATAWLWQQQGRMPNAVGEVEAVRVDVASGVDGVLVPLPHGQWTLFDTVEASQVVAQLDSRPTVAALDTLRRELAQLAKDVEAEQNRVKSDQGDRREAVLAEWLVQQRRLLILDRQAQLEADRVELQQLEVQLEYVRRAHARGALTDQQLFAAQVERDAVAKRVEQCQSALSDARNEHTLAVERLRRDPPLQDPGVTPLLGPVRAAIATQEARMSQLHVQVDGLAIRAPFTGTISAIYGWPGQTIRTGQPIVTIAANQGQYIVSYVRQDQRLQPEVGTTVQVFLRGQGSRPVAAMVERIGPQVLQIPRHQRRDPRVQEWGLPVRINLPGDLKVRPGELVDIVFES